MFIATYNKEENSIRKFNNMKEVLSFINRDRSEDWSNYGESDWREGLEEFTEVTLLSENYQFQNRSLEDVALVFHALPEKKRSLFKGAYCFKSIRQDRPVHCSILNLPDSFYLKLLALAKFGASDPRVEETFN